MIIIGAQLALMATSTRERSSLRVRNLKRETWSSRKASVLKSTGSLSLTVKFWTTAKKKYCSCSLQLKQYSSGSCYAFRTWNTSWTNATKQ